MIFSVNNIWFYQGTVQDAKPHSHFAIQLIFSLQNSITVRFGKNVITTKSILIKSNIPHYLAFESEIFSILVNPISTFGYYLLETLGTKDWIEFNPDWVNELQLLFNNFIKKEISDNDFFLTTGNIFSRVQKEYKINLNFHDDRIVRVVSYLEEHSQEIVPLEEISRLFKLSESRFLHLFKENTGITYRRFQLWNKLMLAGKHILSGMNLTTAAHEAGFADSAHLSRTFKETFGALPKNIIA